MIDQFKVKFEGNEHLNKYDIQVVMKEADVIQLDGLVEEWAEVVALGQMAGSIKGVRGVVNNIRAKKVTLSNEDKAIKIKNGKAKGLLKKVDVLIVGGGVIGCGIARELSKYKLDVLVVEKNSDIAEGTTKANNGMIHSGFDSKTGSLKAQLNVLGNRMYSAWAEELNFKFNRTGSFVAGFDESDDEYLNMYLERGTNNGVPGICILSADEAKEFEPNLHHSVKKVLWTPSAGYVEPYEVTEALAENAYDNGVRFMLNCEVLTIEKDNQVYQTLTSDGLIESKIVINAAGVYADNIAEMLDDRFYTIHPRRGALLIFDKVNEGKNVRFIGTPPRNFTKGGGPTQTPEGNPLWGPSALEVPDKEDVRVGRDDLNFVIEKCSHLVEDVPANSIITFFSGVRASNYIEDFIVEASKKHHGFIHVAGIQSPGLASAPAISKRVEEIVGTLIELNEDETFNPIRGVHKPFRECSLEEKDALIASDKKYSHIICRCETITEAEIVKAIHGKIPALTVDAVKRRTRAGMGRCQGGFCGPRVVEIIARELKCSPTEVTQKGVGSYILEKKSREIV